MNHRYQIASFLSGHNKKIKKINLPHRGSNPGHFGRLLGLKSRTLYQLSYAGNL